MPTDKLKNLITNTGRDSQLSVQEQAWEFIDQGADTNECLLVAASYYYRTEFARLLIEYGKADVNCRDYYARTPLLIATSEASFYKNDPACIRVLLEHGSDPNLYNQYGKSPLLATNNFELIKLLLEHRAAPDHQDNEGITCLMNNVDNPQIIECLLQHGAKPDIQNITGELVRALGLLLKMIQTEKIEKKPEEWIWQSDLEAESKQLLVNIVNSMNQCRDELSKLDITGYQKQDILNVVKEHTENILPISEHHDSPWIFLS